MFMTTLDQGDLKKKKRNTSPNGFEMAESVGEEYSGLVLPRLQNLGVNDWFDPVFLQARIAVLRKHNDIESVMDASVADDASEAALDHE